MITHLMNTDDERVRELAHSMDCIAEPDLCLLADIKPTTAEAWRKRGTGPAYVLLGNRYLYPRKSLAEYMQAILRASSTPSRL